MRISDWSSDVCSSDLLVIIDPVLRPHHAPQIEHDAVRTGVIKREKAFATAGNDACPIDAKLSFFPHQPELHGMPVKPRQPVQRAILQTAQAPAPISLHIIGEEDRKSTRLNSSH